MPIIIPSLYILKSFFGRKIFNKSFYPERHVHVMASLQYDVTLSLIMEERKIGASTICDNFSAVLQLVTFALRHARMSRAQSPCHTASKFVLRMADEYTTYSDLRQISQGVHLMCLTLLYSI